MNETLTGHDIGILSDGQYLAETSRAMALKADATAGVLKDAHDRHTAIMLKRSQQTQALVTRAGNIGTVAASPEMFRSYLKALDYAKAPNIFASVWAVEMALMQARLLLLDGQRPNPYLLAPCLISLLFYLEAFRMRRKVTKALESGKDMRWIL